jgi:tetratricopeptide (TPR) repeat protein
MGFRMRKSIRLAPGVRLNVSKRGVGMSAGAGGVRYSVHSTGRRTVSARTGVPGVYYQKSVGSGSRARPRAAAPVAAPPPRPVKPGLFAPKGEKALYKAIQAQDFAAGKRVGDDHPDYRVLAYSYAGLSMLNDNPEEARSLLSDAFALGEDPAAHPFASKYLYTELDLSIAPGITAVLPINRDAVGLALAELHQDAGGLDAAIDVIEQLEPTTYAAVSLSELYAQAGRYDEMVALTEGIQNEDDATALLCAYRGVAFREQGFHDAAHEAFKEALRSRSRAAPIRHLALSERATNYIAQGKKGMARKDLERILAEDSSFESIRERLGTLDAQ